MAPVVELLSRNNPVFSAFVFYSTILALKMLAMSLLTARQRMRKQIFTSPEDSFFGGKVKVKLDDPDIERIRRGHLNDLENILPFMTVAFFYVLTDPTEFLAVSLFRAFTVARILHTFVYAIVVMPQPSRVLAFGVGYSITIYMALQVILHFL